MSRTVVGDFDVEADGVAFGGRIVAAGECLDRHQVGVGDNVNRLFQVISGGARVRLVAHGSGGRVGDRVAALTHINGTVKRQCD